MTNKFHDLEFKDISQSDLNSVRSCAVHEFVDSKECSQVNLIVKEFMGYLESKGYKITKLDKSKKRVFTGVIAYLDGTPDKSGSAFSKNCAVANLGKPVTISHNFQEGAGHVLGDAFITKDGNKLLYKLDLFTELPPCLVKTLVPCLAGKVIERYGNQVKRIEVTSVGLCGSNTDERILSLDSKKDK